MSGSLVQYPGQHGFARRRTGFDAMSVLSTAHMARSYADHPVDSRHYKIVFKCQHSQYLLRFFSGRASGHD